MADQPTTDSARRRLLAVLLLAALVAGSTWLLAGPQRARSAIPTAAAEAAAAARVVAGFRDGDVVRIHPHWYTGPRLAIAEGIGATRFPWWALDPRGHADPLHLLRYERLWVVAAHEALAGDDGAAVALPLRPLERWEGDRVRVTLHALPPSPIRYDLLHRLGDAEVRRGSRRCRWDAGDLRHRCGEQTWKDVFLTVKEVGDATRQVVYVEPNPANVELTITYPAVPLDGTLVLHTGFSIAGARRTAGADTRVRLLVDGAVVREWIEPKNAFVWRRTTVPGDGGVHAVTIGIAAPEVGWRQLCYDGAVVTAEGAALLGLP